MKMQLLLLGCIVSLAVSLPASDDSCRRMKQRLASSQKGRSARPVVRSCDINGDATLNEVEFSRCLGRLLGAQGRREMGNMAERAACMKNFMTEADNNKDKQVNQKEFDQWTSRWFLSDFWNWLTGGGTTEEEDEPLTTSEIIAEVSAILAYISEDNIPAAVVKAAALVAGVDAPTAETVEALSTALEDGEIAVAIGLGYSIISETSDEDSSAIGVFGLSSNTVTKIATLLAAIISGDSNVNTLIYASVSAVIIDLSPLSADSADTIAGLIQAIVEENDSETYAALIILVDEIEGLSDEGKTALKALLVAVRDENEGEIAAQLFAVFSAIFSGERGSQIAASLAVVLQAVATGDSAAAIAEISKLYALIVSPEGEEPSESVQLVLLVSAVITAVDAGNFEVAGAAMTELTTAIDSGSITVSISAAELQSISEAITNSQSTVALNALVAILQGSSSSSENVSVDVAVALSNVMVQISNEDLDGATQAINDILQGELSSSLSVSVRESLQSVAVTLSTNGGNSAAALTAISAIITGAADETITISAASAASLALIVAALNDDNYEEAGNLVATLIASTSISEEFKAKLVIIQTAVTEENKEAALVELSAILTGYEEDKSAKNIKLALLVSAVLSALDAGDFSAAASAMGAVNLANSDGEITLTATREELIDIGMTIASSNKDEALSLVTALLQGSSSSSENVSEEVAIALSAVMIHINDGELAEAAQAIDVILQGENSASLSTSVKASLLGASALLTADGGDSAAALAIISAVMTGVSYETVTISAESATSLTAIFAAVREENYVDAEALVATLLSSSSISDEFRVKLVIIQEALKEQYKDAALIELSVILSRNSGNAISASTTTALVGVIAGLASGSTANAITAIEAILSTESGDSSLSVEVRSNLLILLQTLRDGYSEEAISEIYVILDGGSLISSSVSATVATEFGIIITSYSTLTATEVADKIDLILNGEEEFSDSARAELEFIVARLRADKKDMALILLTSFLSGRQRVRLSVTLVESLVSLTTLFTTGTKAEIISAIETLRDGDEVMSYEVYAALQAALDAVNGDDNDLALMIIHGILVGEGGAGMASSIGLSILSYLRIKIEGDDYTAASSLIKDILLSQEARLKGDAKHIVGYLDTQVDDNNKENCLATVDILIEDARDRESDSSDSSSGSGSSDDDDETGDSTGGSSTGDETGDSTGTGSTGDESGGSSADGGSDQDGGGGGCWWIFCGKK